MYKLFSVSVKMMDRLKYTNKFILIGLLVLIPMSVMFYIFEGQMKSLIVFTKNEKLGVEYIVPVKDLLSDIQQSRGLSNIYANHDTTVSEQLNEMRKRIDRDFVQLQQIDDRLGKDLKTGDRLKGIADQWKGISAESLNSQDLFAKHSQLIADLISLIATVGDSSNLILDPDLDSYYLMDGIVNKIPEMLEEVAKIRGMGSGYLTKGAMDAASRDEILALYSLSKVSSGNIFNGMTTAIKQNEALKSDLFTINDNNKKLAESYFKLVDENLLHFEMRKLQSKDFYAQSTIMIGEHWKLFDLEAKNLVHLLDQRAAKFQTKVNIFNAVILIAILLLTYLFIGFYLSVSRSVFSIKKALGLFEVGDLRGKVSITTKDELVEIVNSINTMVASFKQTVWNNTQIVNKVYESSFDLKEKTVRSVESLNEVNNNLRELACDAQRQASSMDESSTAMREIASGVQKVAESSSIVSNESSLTFEEAKQGGIVIQNAVKQMKYIQKSVDASASLVELLEGKSSEIGQIVDVIMGISAQTNLLSLNASIEAARAGEHGRGFSVVAQEVKKLAEQSANSAGLITELIREIQGNTNQLVVAMDADVREVTEGLKVIREADEIFGKIVQTTDAVTDNVQEISASSEQMSASAEEVTASIDEITSISRKSSESIAEVSALAHSQLETISQISSAANELLLMANESKEQLNKFII